MLDFIRPIVITVIINLVIVFGCFYGFLFFQILAEKKAMEKKLKSDKAKRIDSSKYKIKDIPVIVTTYNYDNDDKIYYSIKVNDLYFWREKDYFSLYPKLSEGTFTDRELYLFNNEYTDIQEAISDAVNSYNQKNKINISI